MGVESEGDDEFVGETGGTTLGEESPIDGIGGSGRIEAIYSGKKVLLSNNLGSNSRSEHLH